MFGTLRLKRQPSFLRRQESGEVFSAASYVANAVEKSADLQLYRLLRAFVLVFRWSPLRIPVYAGMTA
ncbi:MAG: hypothetical protein M0Q95_04035 [Porticoccaceae bacterium]|nr:hypothetical protein [Porticoccaceae bacterium]